MKLRKFTQPFAASTLALSSLCLPLLFLKKREIPSFENFPNDMDLAIPIPTTKGAIVTVGPEGMSIEGVAGRGEMILTGKHTPSSCVLCKNKSPFQFKRDLDQRHLLASAFGNPIIYLLGREIPPTFLHMTGNQKRAMLLQADRVISILKRSYPNQEFKVEFRCGSMAHQVNTHVGGRIEHIRSRVFFHAHRGELDDLTEVGKDWKRKMENEL
ncbi:MAG: hypothetical protein K0U13_00130 [Chlamydiae bacterium]|nr:hypothetical protein [Chlamydiota bacterium]